MTHNNAHSTLFFDKFRLNSNIIFLSFIILVLHFILLSIFKGNMRVVSNFLWLSIEFVKLPLVIIACVKSRDLIRKGWFFFVIYCILMFSRIGERAYYDLVIHNFNLLPGSYLMFVIGNISVIIAFLMFSHSSEVSFKIKRQLNLLGLIFITIIIISYVINYMPLSATVTVTRIIYTTISSVINISAFIIGMGIYWISIRNKSDKRKVVFILLLLSVFSTFMMNNFYYSPRLIAGKPVTGSYFDLFPTLTMLLILMAAYHETSIAESETKNRAYNLFYVPRVERIIPVISIIIILICFYINAVKADLFLIRTLLLIFIPYCFFLLFFELYSHRSEDAMLAIMGVSPAGVHITDRRMSNTYFVNQSLADLYRGYNMPPDFITLGRPSPEKERIKNLIPVLKSMEYSELPVRRADGTEFDAECIIIPARYYSYDIIITWIVDITDRKKYQEMILEQKQIAESRNIYLDSLLDNLSNKILSGYATLRMEDEEWPDFTITRANKVIKERLNLPTDILGRRFREVFPEFYLKHTERLFSVLSTGESMRIEFHDFKLNRFFNLVIFKTQDDEVGCLIDDITGKKQQERELVEREREISTLLGNLPGMAYRCTNSIDLTLLFASEGSTELAGYRPRELTGEPGRPWSELIHPEDREFVWKSKQKAVKDRKKFNINYRIVSRDSSIKHVWDKGLGIFDVTGNLIFLEGFIFDVTKEKEAELILQNFEKREREMDKARALGQLAGGIAHDINNKLMAIGSCASLLELKFKEDEIKKYTGRIQDGIKQSAELIDNLLTFARQSNRVTEIIPIHEILNKLVQKFKSETPGNITIDYTPDAQFDKINGDFRQLEKAISGIVSNGVEAMPDGGQILIKTENRRIDETPLFEENRIRGDHQAIIISISDTGIGIENENLSRIFDPFFTTKPVGKGSGLGLSAVYGAIQANNGIIKVASTPGSGTTFIIYLPAN